MLPNTSYEIGRLPLTLAVPRSFLFKLGQSQPSKTAVYECTVDGVPAVCFRARFPPRA